MPIIMILHGTAEGIFTKEVYVRSFDHSQAPEDSVILTSNKAEAYKFKDTTAALECWKGVNERVPVRPDGKPNRPLSAYTVELRRIADHA